MHLMQTVSLAVAVFLAVPRAMAWSPAWYATYDHDLIKNKFYPLAAASWSRDGGGTCARLAFPDAQTNLYTVDVNGGLGKYSLYGVTAVSHKERVIAISFRPVTGHSLGGALATLTARNLSGDVGVERVKLATFGQPRTGSKGFVDDCEIKIHNHYRVYRVDDYITFIPPRCSHLGGLLNPFSECNRNGFSHLPKAIRYKHPMGPNDYEEACDDRYIECTNGPKAILEFAEFWNTKPWLAHHMYFGKHISNWGSGNCEGDGSRRRGGLRERSEEKQIKALVLLLARRGFYGPQVQKQAMSIKADNKSMLSVAERLRKAGIPGF